MGKTLTEEQKQIVLALRQHDKIKVNAYAGAGKTTTLLALAYKYPNKRFLILTYNKSVAEELKTKIPPNCVVYTVHGLARKFFPEDKGEIVNKREFIDSLIELFDMRKDRRGVIKTYFFYDIFELFCNSPYLKVNEKVVKEMILSHQQLKQKFIYTFNTSRQDRDYFLENTDLYKKLADSLEYVIYAIDKGNMPVTHDFYLKHFQLNFDAQRIQNFLKRFDVILVDEGQDLNGIQEYILKYAPVPQKVIVGDKHQAIYSWRGAINTLSKLDWAEYSLTTSFRFQDDWVVQTANSFLANWKDDPNTIKALKTDKSNGLHALITRTNARLIKFIHSADSKVKFTRSIDEIFKNAYDGQKILRFVRTGDEWHLTGLPLYVRTVIKEIYEEEPALPLFAKKLGAVLDVEYRFGMYIASKYDIDALYSKASNMHSDDTNVVLTTAHSAKGLEFDYVSIAGDFPDLIEFIVDYIGEEAGSLENVSDEYIENIVNGIKTNKEEYSSIIDEINLQYVALTRAIKSVVSGGSVVENNFIRKLTVDNIKKHIKARLELDEPLWNKLSGEDDWEEFENLE